jgi:O-antigen/teichoic acid export membrane protein
MDPIASIAKNTFVMLASRCVLLALGFAYTMYTARYLGTEGYGIISFALALSAIFLVFSDLGLGTLATREISRNRSLTGTYLSNLAVIKALLVLLASAAIVLFVALSGYPQKTLIVVCLILAYSVIFSFVNLFYAIFQAYEKMEYLSVGAIINSATLFAGAMLAIYLRLDVVSFSLIYCVSIALVLTYCVRIYLKWFFALRSGFDRTFVKQAVIEAWPLGAVAVCVVISLRAGTILLSMARGDAAVGQYSAAYTLSDLATIVPAILASTLFPVIARYHLSSRPMFIFTFSRSVKLLFYMALPMALFITIWAGQFIALIYGSGFSGSVAVLRILIWASAAMYVTIMLGVVFIAANLQMLNLKINAVMAMVSILLNLIVIPGYGAEGTAAVFFLTGAFGLVVAVSSLEALGYKVDLFKVYLVPLAGAVIAGTGYLIMTWLQLSLVVITVACLSTYAIVVLKIGVDKDDLWLLKKVAGPLVRLRWLTGKPLFSFRFYR